MKKQYNIMTSCDDNLVPYLAIGLTAMANGLKGASVDFYLLHSRVSDKNIEMLKALCRELENGMIKFHEVLVPNPEDYMKLAEYGKGWVGEAYYSLCAHLLLPKEVDRVLYLDAGDTLVVNDIEKYYFCDFDDKSLLVTGGRYKTSNGALVKYTQEDLGDLDVGLPGILRGLFNSGSYLLNLNKLRRDGITINDYLFIVEKLREIYGAGNKEIYFGDQGLLSVAFVGDIKYYEYENIRDIYYMPYNFCLWYYTAIKEVPKYKPAIIHFVGDGFKPWNAEYPIFLERFQNTEKKRSLTTLSIGKPAYYFYWHQYASMTDVILTKLGY